MDVTVLEKLTMALRDYCATSNYSGGAYEVIIEPDGAKVRAIVEAPHFVGMLERQAHVFGFLRHALTPEELRQVGCIQTLAPGEERFAWRPKCRS